MDTTWFPFDEQFCHLTYESWRYPENQVNLTTYLIDGEYLKPRADSDMQPNDQWELIGKSVTTVTLGFQRYFSVHPFT